MIHGKIQQTGVPKETLAVIGDLIHTIPKSFNSHNTITKIYKTRKESILKGESIEWATAEAMAFATLLYEGYGVRLSGEDVQRGTFS